MIYFLYKLGRFLVLNLPQGIAYCLAEVFGSAYYFLASNDRAVAASNIQVVLKQKGHTPQVRHATRMTFVNFSYYLTEFLRAAKVNPEFIKNYVAIEGKDNLDKSLKLNRGVILISAHLGNWELGAMVLSILGYKINSIVWTHNNKRINDFFIAQRQSKGLKVIPLGIGIRGVFSALSKNEGVALLGDIDFLHPETGIPVTFFGRETIMPKGPAAFALKTGAPIVPVFLLRERNKKFKFRLLIEPPIICQSSGEKIKDLTRLTQEITKIIETHIAWYPGQWFMLRKRWTD